MLDPSPVEGRTFGSGDAFPIAVKGAQRSDEKGGAAATAQA